MSWNRAEREAAAAASSIFGQAGWPWREEVGGKHKLLVVTLPTGIAYRFPLSGTPRGGVHGAVKLAQINARKLVRKYGVAA